MTAMRVRLATSALCLAVAALAGGAAPAGAAGGAADGIALARAVRIALGRVPAESYEQRGFSYMLSQRGPEAVFRWRWGGGPVEGMVPALERATVGLSKGRVTWWRDELTPLPCREPALCGTVGGAQVPVYLLVLRSGAFYAYGTLARHGCFGRLGGSTPLRPGMRTWTLFGDFAHPAAHGTTRLLKSSFPWGLTGGIASESASISMRTHRPVREQTLIVPPPGVGAPFRFSSSFGYPAHARMPKPALCGPAGP